MSVRCKYKLNLDGIMGYFREGVLSVRWITCKNNSYTEPPAVSGWIITLSIP